jgi:uncharacterized protein (TIGR02757 family)
MNKSELKKWLNEKADYYNRPFFIESDPISVPHLYTQQQDIEIAGFFAAIFAWGRRATIISKAKELMQLMDCAPHQFIQQHHPKDLRRFLQFKHRTFNATDLLYCIQFLQNHYRRYTSLSDAFTRHMKKGDKNVEFALAGFHDYFFSREDAPDRTRKHIATPARASSCKRLNMYLRWMVRKDDRGVDFGIWDGISMQQLVMPLDLHVCRVAVELKLMEGSKSDWDTAVGLTEKLKRFDAGDPVRYDFALFGSGAMEASF